MSVRLQTWVWPPKLSGSNYGKRTWLLSGAGPVVYYWSPLTPDDLALLSSVFLFPLYHVGNYLLHTPCPSSVTVLFPLEPRVPPQNNLPPPHQCGQPGHGGILNIHRIAWGEECGPYLWCSSGRSLLGIVGAFWLALYSFRPLADLELPTMFHQYPWCFHMF